MARDKDRYSRDQRFEVILDNGEDHTRWSDLFGSVENVVSGTEHITAARSVSFDKVAGSEQAGFIVRPLDVMNGVDLDAFSSEGQILSSVYFSDLTDVVDFGVGFLMSSGIDNGILYNVGVADLSVGWNHLKFDCNDYVTSLGAGVDWKRVKYLTVGVDLNLGGDSLSNILVDSVRVQLPTATSSFAPNLSNVTTSTSTSTGGGAASGLSLYSSPVHFTAVYQAAASLDLSGMAFSITDFSQFVEIVAWDASGVYIDTYTPKTEVFSWDSVNDRVTVTGAAFVSGGTYTVSVLAADRTISVPTDSQKTTVLNPLSEDYSYETAAEVTNEADASTDYYVSMDGFRSCIVQYEITGGTDTVDLTVHGTVQGDAAASSCKYDDITQYGMDILTHTTTSGSYDSDTLLKTQEGSSYKYLKFNIAKTGSSDDTDYNIYVKKLY